MTRKPRGKRGVPPSGKPTMRTIADMTGLAVTTISRALNNAPEISQETRDKVQRIAAEIGYLKDRTALRLKTGQTNVITLVLSPNEEILGFGSSLVGGLTAALRNTQYHLVVTPNFRNVSPMEPILHIVRNRLADGIVFSRTEPHDERARYLLDSKFPFVSHGRTEWPEPHPFVDFDNDAFAEMAVWRLVERGCRRILILLPANTLTYSGHLRAGFERAIAAAGIASEIPVQPTLDSPADAVRDFVMARMRQPNPPDGFVCCAETAAVATIAGLTDSGIAVGERVHVVAKQASPLFSQFRPKVDTIFEDVAMAGEQLGKLLLRRIAGEPANGLQVLDRPRDWT